MEQRLQLHIKQEESLIKDSLPGDHTGVEQRHEVVSASEPTANTPQVNSQSEYCRESRQDQFVQVSTSKGSVLERTII